MLNIDTKVKIILNSQFSILNYLLILQPISRQDTLD